MKYPKPFMKKEELMEMGLTRRYLDRAIAVPGQTFAFKVRPEGKTSPYIFDTVQFEEWRMKEVKMAANARRMKAGVM